MKVQNLLFVKYSNYSNRLIKPIGAYMTDYYTEGDDVLEVAKVNFHQGNGIYAEQVVTTDFSSFVYNYLLTSDNDDATLKVTTRWFVIGKEDLRNGQVRVSLKRDLISDYFNDVVNADFMMERGNLDFGRSGLLSNTRNADPLVFLKEDQQYNQIKKAEYRLFRYGEDFDDEDLNEPAWLVGYVPKNISGYQTVEIQEVGEGGEQYGTVWALNFDEYNIQNNRDDAFNIIAMPLKDCSFVYNVGPRIYLQKKKLSIAIMTALAAKGILYDLQVLPYLPKMDVADNQFYWNKVGGNIILSSTVHGSPLNGPYAHSAAMEYGVHQGIYPGNLKYQDDGSTAQFVLPQSWTNTGNILSLSYVSDTGETGEKTFGNLWINKTWAFKNGRIELIPNTDYKYTSGSDYIFINQSGDISLSAAMKNLIARCDAGQGHFELIYQVGSAPVDDNGDPYANPCIISLANSTDEFFIQIDDDSSDVDTSISIDNIKESVNTDLYRIVSPNQEGIFEWSPAMNYAIKRTGQSATTRYCNWNSYKVALSLKPFNPYIRISPDFDYESEAYPVIYNSFYGYNFNDGRGLICGGDFSITMPSSAWENYQLNNKTWASAFGRNVQTLEIKDKYMTANSIINTVGATVAGAAGGFMKGGPYGAIAGGVMGLIGGAWNAESSSQIRKEGIKNYIAQFGMSMQSIQARPDSLTKISAFDPDNKIWPYVEVYSCSDAEKELFRAKMSTEGMIAHKKTTIISQMTNTTVYYTYEPEGVGVIHEVYQYFSGTIIKMPTTTTATPEMINEISSELETGIYFNVELF